MIERFCTIRIKMINYCPSMKINISYVAIWYYRHLLILFWWDVFAFCFALSSFFVVHIIGEQFSPVEVILYPLSIYKFKINIPQYVLLSLVLTFGYKASYCCGTYNRNKQSFNIRLLKYLDIIYNNGWSLSKDQNICKQSLGFQSKDNIIQTFIKYQYCLRQMKCYYI